MKAERRRLTGRIHLGFPFFRDFFIYKRQKLIDLEKELNQVINRINNNNIYKSITNK